MSGSATPGMMYAVRQVLPELAWQVIQVERWQGERWQERKEPHVYDTSTQAHAVKDRLNGLRAARLNAEKMERALQEVTAREA